MLAEDLPAGPIVATVTTPDELVAALATGSQHIELKDHLDLRGYQPPQVEATTAAVADADGARRRLLSRRGLRNVPPDYVDTQESWLLPAVRLSTHTITGDCSASTTLPVVGSGAPLAEQQSRSQCYILSPGDLFRLDEEAQQLVIDNVFLRIDRAPPDGGPVVTDGVPTLIDVRAPNTKLWLTAATLQSDFGAGRALDIADASGSVYVEDALVRDFDTRGTPAVTTAGALHVVDTQFELMAAAQEEAAGGAPVVYAARTAVVALEGVLFSGGSGPTLGQAANIPTVFYSDDLTHEVVLYEQDAEGRPVEVDRTTPEPLSALTAAQNKTLIGPDDPWFLATRTAVEAAPELPITRVLQVAPSPGGDGDGGTSRALIGGIIAGAAVAIVLVAVLAFFTIRRHRGSRASGASGTTAVSSHKTNGGSYTATTVLGRTLSASTAAAGPHPQGPSPQGSGDSGVPDSPLPSSATPTAGAPSLPSYLQPSTSAAGPLYGPPTQSGRVAATQSISPDSSSGSPAFGAAGTPLGGTTHGRVRRTSEPGSATATTTGTPHRTMSGSGSVFSMGSAVLGPGGVGGPGRPDGGEMRGAPMPSLIEQSEGGTELTMTVSADLEADVIRLPSPANGSPAHAPPVIGSPALGATTTSSRGRELTRSPPPIPEGRSTPPLHSEEVHPQASMQPGATQPRSGPSPVPEIDFADRPAATAAGPLPPLPLAKAAAAVPLAGGRNWPLRPNASPEERIRFLGTQLDALTATNDGVVLDRFKLLGAQARRPAGQGLIQFARGTHSGTPYAMKFCITPSAFAVERAVYAHSELAHVLPRVASTVNNADGGFCDPGGTPMPPCIIVERGRPIDEWATRGKPPTHGIALALKHVGRALATMHDVGYVHRNIKPANVVWLPHDDRWALIDFGCAAHAGSTGPLRFSLAYAAPEVVHLSTAPPAGPASTAVSTILPAVDAWALGVVAYELMTGSRAFLTQRHRRERVIQMLRGEKPLPWEEHVGAPAVNGALGVLRDPILGLLERDPDRRTTVRAFAEACERAAAQS